MGDRHSTGRLGALAHDTGDIPRAHACYVESLRQSQRVGNARITLRCLDGLANVAALNQQPGVAARLWGVTGTLRHTLALPLAAAEREAQNHAQDRVRHTLGADAWAQAIATGQVLSLELTVAVALGDVTTIPL